MCVAGPQQQEVELGGGGGDVLTAVCDHLGLQQHNMEVRAHSQELLQKLDSDLDGRVSIRDFHKVLRGSAPISCSTPVRSADLQRALHRVRHSHIDITYYQ